jgi:hypothetical protein
MTWDYYWHDIAELPTLEGVKECYFIGRDRYRKVFPVLYTEGYGWHCNGMVEWAWMPKEKTE